MPVKLEMMDGGKGSILIATGCVTAGEIIDAIHQRFDSEESIKRYKYCLADYTGVDELKVSTEDVRLIVQQDIRVSKLNPDLVLALAASRELTFGMSRMFEILIEGAGWDTNVFHTFEDAQAWVRSIMKRKGYHSLKVEHPYVVHY